MDFTFTPEEKAFQQEIRSFFEQEVTEEFLCELEDSGEPDFSLEFSRKLADKGWLAMAWPREYGGGGATMMEQLIFTEEVGYHRGPTGGHRQGVKLIGPCLIVEGTEEQKKQHLPAITRVEEVWSQGFSEPEAGSDLASVQCRAVKDGDDYIINGQKVWTTNGHHANWMHMLARTDPEAPKHRGISYFMVDMKSPGITVRPLINMLMSHEFNEVFLDNVRVPRENMVGPENEGWRVANTTLNFERSGVAYCALARRNLDDIIQYTKEASRNGQPLIKDPLVRNKLGDLVASVEVGRMICYRVAWMQGKGLVPTYEAGMAKLYTTELLKWVTATGMEILGLYGQLMADSKLAPILGMAPHSYLGSKGYSLQAGTTEILRGIVAGRGLGLPSQ